VPSDAYVASFSFEWKRRQRTQFDSGSRKLSESTFVVSTGTRPQELAGKLVLDVGCRSGRIMDVLARAGAEIVGLDLSLAVDVARQNLRSLPNCHFIQADALYPRFVLARSFSLTALACCLVPPTAERVLCEWLGR
jgi:SAM-dependent methyltransferase